MKELAPLHPEVVRRSSALVILLVGVAAGCSGETSSDGSRPEGASSSPSPQVRSASCADPPTTPAAGEPAPRHDIAFVSDRGGTVDLWVLKPRGGDPRRLTDDSWQEDTPRWSPDGTRLAFACSPTPLLPSDLYVMDADGTDRRQLTTTSTCEALPAWSPDGTHLFYLRNACDDGRTALWTLPVDGGESRRVLGDTSWFDLSPDGERLVYARQRSSSFLDMSLWLSDADGTAATEIGPAGAAAAYEPAWSPDGTQIAFVAPSGDPTSDDPVEWNEDIYVMSPTGTDLRRTTTTPGNDHWPPAWSPDGRELLFSSDGLANEHGVLSMVDLDTLDVVALTPPGSNATFPTWRR